MQPFTGHGQGPLGRRIAALLLGLAACLCLDVHAEIRLEEPLEETTAEADALQAVFDRLAMAWSAGDEKTLAELVHPDGVLISTAQARHTTYSPSQAYYYFKNLFQGRRNVSFAFVRTQDVSAGDLVHGLAEWEFILDDDWQTQDLKLEFVLTDEDGAWQLTRINTIR